MRSKGRSLDYLIVQRKWLGFYGGAVRGRTGFEHENAAVTLAPEYTDADLETVWVGNRFSSEQLLAEAVSPDSKRSR